MNTALMAAVVAGLVLVQGMLNVYTVRTIADYGLMVATGERDGTLVTKRLRYLMLYHSYTPIAVSLVLVNLLTALLLHAIADDSGDSVHWVANAAALFWSVIALFQVFFCGAFAHQCLIILRDEHT